MSHRIFMYHNIGEDKAFFTVSPEMFLWHMMCLRACRYTIVPLDQIVCRKDLSIRSVALSFDDAYVGIYTHVFPIIKRLRIPISVFVPTQYMGKSMKNSEGFSFEVMNEDMIQEMKDTGLVDFYSHGHAHIPSTETTLEVFEKDLQESIQEIHRIGGKDTIFCYPKGKIQQGAEKIVSDNGFTYALGVQFGLYTQKDSLYNIRRIPIDKAVSKLRFLVYLTPLIRSIPWLRAIYKKI